MPAHTIGKISNTVERSKDAKTVRNRYLKIFSVLVLVPNQLMNLFMKTLFVCWALVAHTCNPIYLRVQMGRIMGQGQPQANSS
jgi:hypothetical protein